MLIAFWSFSPSWYYCTLWGSATPEQAPLSWESAGYRAIWDWVGFLWSWEWGDGGALKRDPPGAFPLTYTPVCSGIPLHFQALLCLWPRSLESPRKCIPLPALNDHITLNSLGSMIPLQCLEDYIVAIGKSTDRLNLYECGGSVLSFFSSVNQ